jgi:UDP-glucose 4-epimerase
VAKFLVTGGAGFIGSHVVERLIDAGHGVRVLDDLSTGTLNNLRNIRQNIEFLRGSVTDRAAVRAAMQDINVCIHLAALPSVQRSVEDPLATHATCATGTLHVLEAARDMQVQRVVYAASSSAYGETPGMIRRETDPVAPLSPYAIAKLMGEEYCRCFTRLYGLETVCLRFFNIFGPRQAADSPYSGVIAKFAALMAAGQVPTIDGNGLQSRDFTYVANAVQAVMLAAASRAAPGKVYNVGTGGSVSVLTLVEELNHLLGTAITPLHGPARAGDVRHSQADISLAQQDLGYTPTVSFRTGLRLTLDSLHGSSTPMRRAASSREQLQGA